MTDLTENLRKQLERSSLTEDLRRQVDQQKLTADLKAQLKKNEACAPQADKFAYHFDHHIQGLKLDVADLKNGLDSVRQATSFLGYELADHTSAVDEIVEGIQEDIHYLHSEVSELRAAEHQRRLQSRFNEALAKNKTVGNKAQGGSSNMKSLLTNIKNLFGKVEGQFALSIFGGVAVRKTPFSQSWVTYDETNGITDVEGNVLKFDVPAFRLPAEPKAIKRGDIVVGQSGNYGYVTQVSDGFVRVIYPATASHGSVMPIRNPILNKSFYTTVQVLDLTAGQTGGFDPLLLMAMSGKGSTDDLLPLILMSGGLGGNTAGIDPMLLALVSDNMDDILPFVLLQQGGFTKEGFNPLLLFALSSKDGAGKDMLPLLLATGQGGNIQSMLPLLLMGDGGIDFKDLIMIQALTGQNIFIPQQAQQPQAATQERTVGEE